MSANKKNRKEENEKVEQQSKEVTAKMNNESSLTIGAAVSRVISSSATAISEDTSLVEIRISYPKDYKRKMFFKNNEIKKVSKEVAQQFADMGIAEIV